MEKKGRGSSERLEIANKVNDNPGAGDTAGGWVSGMQVLIHREG